MLCIMLIYCTIANSNLWQYSYNNSINIVQDRQKAFSTLLLIIINVVQNVNIIVALLLTFCGRILTILPITLCSTELINAFVHCCLSKANVMEIVNLCVAFLSTPCGSKLALKGLTLGNTVLLMLNAFLLMISNNAQMLLYFTMLITLIYTVTEC